MTNEQTLIFIYDVDRKNNNEYLLAINPFNNPFILPNIDSHIIVNGTVYTTTMTIFNYDENKISIFVKKTY